MNLNNFQKPTYSKQITSISDEGTVISGNVAVTLTSQKVEINYSLSDKTENISIDRRIFINGDSKYILEGSNLCTIKNSMITGVSVSVKIGEVEVKVNPEAVFIK